jgi:hypothetical protein
MGLPKLPPGANSGVLPLRTVLPRSHLLADRTGLLDLLHGRTGRARDLFGL